MSDERIQKMLKFETVSIFLASRWIQNGCNPTDILWWWAAWSATRSDDPHQSVNDHNKTQWLKMVVLLNNHQLLPWQMLHSGGIEDTFLQFRMICGLFWHNNWPVILATEPSRPIYGLLPFGAQTDKAAAKWHRRCTPQCEDGLKIFHRNQYRSRTSRLPVPCDAAATPLCWAFPPTSLTFKPKLKNGSRSADCKGHCKVASWYLERRYVAFRFSFVDVYMLNPNKGVLSMKIIRWVFYSLSSLLSRKKVELNDDPMFSHRISLS